MSLSSLMLETLFTRIFTSTLWAQFAFMAVSVAMLGLTAGAMLVYLWPRFSRPDQLERQLVISAVLFGASIPVSLLLHLLLPIRELDGWPAGIALAVEFLVLTVPFLFSGINVALVLTRYGGDFRKLYASDLFGAALGCILFILSIQLLGPVDAILGVVVLGFTVGVVYALPHRQWLPLTLGPLLISLVVFVGNLLGDWVGPSLPEEAGELGMALDRNLGPQSLRLLHLLLGLTSAIFVLFLAGPFLLKGHKLRKSSDAAYLAYFSLIGIGFMLIEISQLQYLTVLLGNASYGIFIVLGTLLLATGIGSYLGKRSLRRTGLRRLNSLVFVLILTGFATVEVMSEFGQAVFWLRCLLGAGLLLPMGILMGMAMPLGMALAMENGGSRASWFWGVNGAASVMASVLAAVLGVTFGMETPFWVGVAAYALAVFVYWRLAARN